MDHPKQRPGQSLADHQAEVAAWLGYSDADAMNAEHDRWHLMLARWLGIRSQSLREADGETLSDTEQRLAWMEENAVLAVQRLHRHAVCRVN